MTFAPACRQSIYFYVIILALQREGSVSPMSVYINSAEFIDFNVIREAGALMLPILHTATWSFPCDHQVNVENQAHLRIQPYTVHKEVTHLRLWICHISQILISVNLHFFYTYRLIHPTAQKNTVQRFTVVSVSASEDPLFISGSSSKHHHFSSPV